MNGVLGSVLANQSGFISYDYRPAPYMSMNCIDMIRHYGVHYLHSDLFVTSLNDLSESDYDLDEIVSVHNFGSMERPMGQSQLFSVPFSRLLDCRKDGGIRINCPSDYSFELYIAPLDDLYISSFKATENVCRVAAYDSHICFMSPFPSHGDPDPYLSGFDSCYDRGFMTYVSNPSCVKEFARRLDSIYSPQVLGFNDYAYEISRCSGDLYVSNVILKSRYV